MTIHGRLVAIGLVAGIVSIQGLAQTGTGASRRPPASSAGHRRTDFTVPAGTKVLLSLKSGINTKTAQQGDGVYLVSSFPVVGNSRVMSQSGLRAGCRRPGTAARPGQGPGAT